MKKVITVHELTLSGEEGKSVNYPSERKAKDAQETLKAFGLESTISKTKKTVEL